MTESGSALSGQRRESGTLEYIPPVHPPSRLGVLLRRLAILGCVLGWAVGTAASATALVALGEPPWVSRYGAALATFVLTVALAHRSGGQVWVWSTLVLAALAGTLLSSLSGMYAALSVVTAVVAAVVAVMVTRPASTGLRAALEFVLALVVAASGAVAVAAWNAPVAYQRYDLLVLALSLVLTLGLVWGLGTGLHGLGRRGFALIAGAAVLLALVLAYGTAVRLYGSPAVVDTLDDTVRWIRETIGGVPRPAQVLIGFPALVWGIGTRASRRQGWWMCVFGVVGTSSVATSLASPDAEPTYIALSTLYSAVLGLALGLLVRRFAPGGRPGSGRRVRRAASTDVGESESGRTEPLTYGR